MEKDINLDNFDFDKTILVYVDDENIKRVIKKFETMGNIDNHKYDEENSVLIIEFTDSNSVLQSKEKIFDESFISLNEIDYNKFGNSLSVPGIINNFLISPPPSPPEGWNQIREDINRVHYVDLEEFVLDDGKIQLLAKSDSSPAIIIDPDC